MSIDPAHCIIFFPAAKPEAVIRCELLKFTPHPFPSQGLVCEQLRVTYLAGEAFQTQATLHNYAPEHANSSA